MQKILGDIENRYNIKQLLALRPKSAQNGAMTDVFIS
jgi:hypothetical protein